jgi:hypothetical protein
VKREVKRGEKGKKRGVKGVKRGGEGREGVKRRNEG